MKGLAKFLSQAAGIRLLRIALINQVTALLAAKAHPVRFAFGEFYTAPAL